MNLDLQNAIGLVRAEGLEVKDNGNMLCPFHAETKPSAYLYYNKYHNQVEFHCFGCGKSYSFERFLSLIKGEETEEKQEQEGKYSLDFVATRLHNNFLALLNGAGEPAEQELARQGFEYLKSRGFDLRDIDRGFIGFVLREQLEVVEDFKANSWVFDKRRTCFLVYPIMNKKAEVCSLQFEDFLNRGRLEQTKLNLKGKPLPLCFLTPYCKDLSYIVCEGFLDALSIEKVKPGAIALLGTPSKEQKEELKEVARTNEIILAFDNDETGRRYQSELLKELVLVNPYIMGLSLPAGIKDLNELLQKEGTEGIERVLREVKKITPFGNVKERVPQILERFRIAKENAFPIPDTISYLGEFFKDGLFPGLYGVAGVPGVGKTTWLNLFCDELAKIGYKSIYFLTEEPEYRLLLRTIKRENLKSFQELIQKEWIENRITFELTPEYKAEVLKDIVSGIIEREGKAIFIVDSLHALQLGSDNSDTREKIIFKTELLAHIARDLMIPVFFTSFIPKSLYREKPSIGVFKEAGEIEYLIDVGMVFWKDIGENKDLLDVSLHIVKNRFGKTGEVDLVFDVVNCNIREQKKGEKKGA